MLIKHTSFLLNRNLEITNIRIRKINGTKNVKAIVDYL